MADTTTCPTLSDFLNEDNCLENIGGTSAVAYYFLKSDLKAALKRTGNVYETPAFNAGKGLYKIDLKDETQQVQGSSQGQNGGFALTYNATIDMVNKKVSELARALNNLDYGIIVPDGEGDAQILYDPNHRVVADSDGIKTDTGAATGDDRQTTLEFKLNGVLYPALYVTTPEGGWESLLASAATGE